MNVVARRAWTIEEFLDWVGAQDERHEFDGFRPVAMTGGNARHTRVMNNVHAALRARLRGKACAYYGPDLGVQTIGNAVRYPDALVTCTKFPDTDRLAPDVRIVFEVVSPISDNVDRVEKVREYAAVPSLRRYVILETASATGRVLHRQRADQDWSTAPLTFNSVLELPEIDISIPMDEFYEDVAFGGSLPE